MKAQNDRHAAPPAPVITANDRVIVERFVARLRMTFAEEASHADVQS